jgi:methionine-rich copper-binding protein CopC
MTISPVTASLIAVIALRASAPAMAQSTAPADPHAGHVMTGAPAAPAPETGMDHSKMPGMAPASGTEQEGAVDPHAGHDMMAPPATPAPAEPMDHSAMPGTAPSTKAAAAQAPDPHAGHDMKDAPAAAASMPGMDHADMPAMDHSGMDHGAMPAMGAASTGTALTFSSPAAGAMVTGSPSEITFVVPHAMSLKSVMLTNSAGQRIPLATTLADAPTAAYSSPVPKLVAGTYQVAWSASSADHDMAGTFSFMVH